MFESIQLTTQTAFPGNKSIQHVTEVVFQGTDSMRPIAQPKRMQFWMDLWFNSQLHALEKLVSLYLHSNTLFKANSVKYGLFYYTYALFN